MVPGAPDWRIARVKSFLRETSNEATMKAPALSPNAVTLDRSKPNASALSWTCEIISSRNERGTRTNPFEDLDSVIESIVPAQSILRIGKHVGAAEEAKDVDAVISRNDDESLSLLRRLTSDPLGGVVKESIR